MTQKAGARGSGGRPKEQTSRLTRGSRESAHASASPRYWAAKNAWFVKIGDTRHSLGKHPENVPPLRKRSDPPPVPPDSIMQAYYRHMATADRKLTEAETLKVCQVCDLFLDYSEKHHEPATYRGYKDFLQDF